MTNSKKAWKEFETLVSTIHSHLAPDADVKENVKLVGRRSGRKRQLDICIRQSIGPYPILIVIECKRQKRRIRIDQVEHFAKKLEDIGATQGVFVSWSDFSDGARAIARDNLVTLLTYREAEETDWKDVFRDDAWLRMLFTQRENVQATVDLLSGSARVVSPDEDILNNEGAQVAKANDLLLELWESTKNLKPVGDFKVHIAFPETPLYLSGATGLELIKTLTIQGRNRMFGYMINLRLVEGHVLEDNLSRRNVYSEFFTESFNWRDIVASRPATEVTEEEYAARLGSSGE